MVGDPERCRYVDDGGWMTVRGAGSAGTRPWVVNAAPDRWWPGLQLQQFWHHRELIFFFALRDVKVRYKQAFLGVAWAGIQPLVGALAFTILFHRLADVDVEGTLVLRVRARRASGSGRTSRRPCRPGRPACCHNADLLTKVAFPRIVAPTAALLPGLIDLVGRRSCSSTGHHWSRATALRASASLIGLRPVRRCAARASRWPGPVLFFSASIVRYRDTSVAGHVRAAAPPVRQPGGLPARARARRLADVLYLNPVAGALGLLRCGLARDRAAGAPQLVLSAPSAIVVLLLRPAPLPAQRARVRGHHLMARPVIELDGVGKRYRLGEHHGTRHRPARDARAPCRRRLRGRPPRGVRDLWSLRDVSFAVDEGSRSASSAPTAPARARC